MNKNRWIIEYKVWICRGCGERFDTYGDADAHTKFCSGIEEMIYEEDKVEKELQQKLQTTV